jgi:hypothetical protein
MHSVAVEKFVEETDFLTITPADVKKLSERRFKAIFDCLEDWNHHTANLLFVALRRGTDKQIELGRQILATVEKNGFMSADVDADFYTLLRELFPLPSTPAPPVYREKTQSEIFGSMAAALYCLADAPQEWAIPDAARETYRDLASYAFKILNPA